MVKTREKDLAYDVFLCHKQGQYEDVEPARQPIGSRPIMERAATPFRRPGSQLRFDYKDELRVAP